MESSLKNQVVDSVASLTLHRVFHALILSLGVGMFAGGTAAVFGLPPATITLVASTLFLGLSVLVVQRMTWQNKLLVHEINDAVAASNEFGAAKSDKSQAELGTRRETSLRLDQSLHYLACSSFLICGSLYFAFQATDFFLNAYTSILSVPAMLYAILIGISLTRPHDQRSQPDA